MNYKTVEFSQKDILPAPDYSKKGKLGMFYPLSGINHLNGGGTPEKKGRRFLYLP